jgi:hypothetical protein
MTILSQLDHPNLVVIHYWPYQGGKFFANCLAHHTGVMPQLAVTAQQDAWALSPPGTFEKQKIQRIYSSLPPEDRVTEWVNYELGCKGFWGGNLTDIMNRGVEPNAGAVELLNYYKCFMMSHVCNPNFVDALKIALPSARHIVLTNAKNFANLAIDIKEPGVHMQGWLARNQLPADAYFKFPNHKFDDQELFQVNVDQTYFDRSLVRGEVERCLQWLNLDTTLDSEFDRFVDQYFRLHGLL